MNIAFVILSVTKLTSFCGRVLQTALGMGFVPVLRFLTISICIVAGVAGPARSAELNSGSNSPATAASPFDVRNGVISDPIKGPMIVDPRQQDESRTGYANSALYHIFFLTYARQNPERGPEITIAAEPDTTGKELFVFDKAGLLSKTPPSSAAVDKNIFEAFKASHRDSNVNILANDSAGQSHHITITSGGALDIAALGKITDHSECLISPQRLRVDWDGDIYDVVIILPAIYGKYDGTVNPYDDDCVSKKIQTKNSHFADMSLGDTFTPSSTNFYISSFHTIYVLPISYFSRGSINSNNIVFDADGLNKSIAKKYLEFSRGNSKKSKCTGTALDCAQSILDNAMHALVRQRG